MNSAQTLLPLIVLVIGLYMVITYWGAITPPLLSGVAFTLIGFAQLGDHKKKK